MIAKKIAVNGIAVRSGISKNGILYTAEELEKFTPTLKDKPILKDHRGEVDNTIGLIESSNSIGDGVVNYSGWVKEDGTGLIDKINDKRIKEVSIGAFASKLVKESEDDEFIKAEGLEAMELSLTPVPAVTGTSLKQTLESINNKKTGEKIKIVPFYESTKDFKKIETSENIEVPQEIFEKYSYLLNDTEVDNMAEEEKPKEQAEEKPAEDANKEDSQETKPEDTSKESKEAEPENKEVKQSVKIDVDTSKLDETIQKMEKIADLKEKIKDKPIQESKTEEKIDKTHGKVKEAEENKEQTANTGYVVESSELGEGFQLYKMPDANGNLRGE